MTEILTVAIVILGLLIAGSMYRVFKGPTAADRLVAVNVIGTKTVILILLVASLLKQTYFVDVAIVYALISFVATIIIARSITREER